jgi:predicted DNA-binding transcriptional regulator YafY
MVAANHDTLVRRLAMILVKLNQGEKLDPKQLANEFDVHQRTVQRDINERFGYLPLEKSAGKYFLNPAFLGKLSFKDIERFASLAGVAGLFPTLSEEFLREIFDARIQSTFLIRGHQFEDLRAKEEDFKKLEQAIVGRLVVSFFYKSGDHSKAFEVEPYRLINNKGVWYLAAMHSEKLKTFSFSKIERLLVTAKNYSLDQKVNQTLESEEGVWIGEQPIEIVLKIDRSIAPYFKRRKLIANQVIEKELADGSLFLSTRVGHRNQVIPIVKYWIPNIRVISPVGLQDAIDEELHRYLTDSRF